MSEVLPDSNCLHWETSQKTLNLRGLVMEGLIIMKVVLVFVFVTGKHYGRGGLFGRISNEELAMEDVSFH